MSVGTLTHPTIRVDHVHKHFTVGSQSVQVLRDVSLEVKEGEFLLLHGPSGSGKSTLLHTILGLEPPTTGQVTVIQQNLYELSEAELALFHKTHVGMVHQQPYWIKSLNVLENVVFPLMLKRIAETQRNQQAMEVLKLVGMQDWAYFHPSELSSGQQQRVSLARALISNPSIIVADEPTGNLDFDSGVQLMDILKSVNGQSGKTILMVTHDLGYMKYASRTISMLDGKIVDTTDGTRTLMKEHDKRHTP